MSGATAAFVAERADLMEDRSLTGLAHCRAATELTDRWLAALFDDATVESGARLALVAVGGYGRAELCPGSDLDVLLLYDGRGGPEVTTVAERVWYPIWDVGLKLGHAVRTVKDSLDLATTDLDAATSFLSCRHIAGDVALTERLSDAALQQWRKHAGRWLRQLEGSVQERHATHGEVAFLLEPNLKEGRGGLRDVHSLGWAEAARPVLTDVDHQGLADAYQTLLAVRVEVHRESGHPQEVLALQDQDAIAAALGDADADALMARVARAARAIAWPTDEVWHRIHASMYGGRRRHDRTLSDRLVLVDSEVHIRSTADPERDAALALEAAAAAASLGTTLDMQSLNLLAKTAPPLPDPWPAEARAWFADTLLAGEGALRVIEAFDQKGIWERVLPEWTAVRCKPQRNAYHRFTVDRHLVETAIKASALASRVDRPDILVVGALLHDIGKGFPGDHTEVGSKLVDAIARRMGFDDDDVADLVAMVDHHLLLAETATRRDLSDPSTVEAVAAAVKTPSRLRLLAALTEADSLATGSSSWSPWKAGLVARLVEHVDLVLRGTVPSDVVHAAPRPTVDANLTGGGPHTVIDGENITVAGPDHPGTFSRVAGVLALHGLDIRAAHAWSEGDVGLSRFHVDARGRAVEFPRVVRDIDLALQGRLALEARLAERASVYAPRGTHQPSRAHSPVSVAFDDGASATATVIDVRAPDAIGLLYRVTREMAELDLDLRTALIETLGPVVADAFYVTNRAGGKVTDLHHRQEIERAVTFACRPRP